MTVDLEGARFTREMTALIPHMRAFARGLCGDMTTAEDLAQEALAKAWSARASYQPGTNLKGWLFTILRNQFYSEKRRSWRNVPLDQEKAERTLVAIADPTATLWLDDVRRAMRLLPDGHREALVLIGAAGCSYDEAARMCGCPVGTVKSRVSRARTQLAEILAGSALPRDAIRPSAAMADIFEQCERAGGLPLAA